MSAFEIIRSGMWLTRERMRFIALAVMLASFAGLGFLAATSSGLNDYQGRPLGTDFSNVYATISALRSQANTTKAIPIPKLVPILRKVLDRPELADLAIPLLAEWEDWESLARLHRLFIEADVKTTWVREPILKFVKACPLPEAEAILKELEQLDPVAAKSAKRTPKY